MAKNMDKNKGRFSGRDRNAKKKPMVKKIGEDGKEIEVGIEEVVSVRDSSWVPKTVLGTLVKEGKITDIDEVFERGLPILEAEITNALLPNLEEDLLLIGQAKGKFGGGQRRIFRQTQKKTQEGNKPHFTVCAVVGNRNGYVGVGFGKSKETVPSRDKARLKARLNIIQIRRGSGSWESASKEPRSIPFAVEGKCGSVRMLLFPAPKGKGLCIEKECAKVLELAGIKDIWSKSRGQTRTKINSVMALMDALRKLSEVKIRPEDVAAFGLAEGKLKQTEEGIEDTDRVMPEEQ